MKTYKLKIKGKDYTVDVLDVEDFSATVKVNGVLYDVEIDQHLKTTKTPKLVRAMAFHPPM